MFDKLKELYDEINEFDNRNVIGDYDIAEYIDLISNFISVGEEYYGMEELDFDVLLKMVEYDLAKNEKKENNKRGVDHYEMKDVMAWIAGFLVDGEYFGDAISEEELVKRLEIQNDFVDEIEFAKIIISNNPIFESMTYKDKINFISNMLVQLRVKRKDLNRGSRN